MGRPLNKKYFGNRNLGTGGYEVSGGLSNSQNYADDRIGGEGVAAITGLDGNEGRYTNTVPTVTFSDPSIPGGVTALAGDVHVYALRAYPDVANIGNNYHYGDVLKLNPDGVWSGTQMSFTVTHVQTVGVTILDDGSACDVGDKLRYDGTYGGGTWSTPLEILVTGSSGGNITSFTVTQAGVWTGAAAPSDTTGATMTQIAAGSDWNAAGAEFSLTWGVNAVTVTQAGDHTSVPGNVSTSVVTSVAPSGGTGAKLFVEYGVNQVEIAEKGSGYINVGDAAVTFSNGDIWRAYGTAVLTTDSGGVNNQIDALNDPDNQDNAILIYANTDGEGAALGDIIKQTNARSYKVNNGSATAICKLVADGTPAEGEAYINATDSDGGTYYVTKLTAHRALLTRNTGTQFATGQSAKWTFGDAVASSSVKVDNA